MKKTVVGVGVVGALVYFLMGGLGLGIGPGEGESTDAKQAAPPEKKAEEEAPEPMPEPCLLRLDRRGLWRDDAAVTVDQAIAACKEAGRASVTVTGDATQGDLDDLNRAFEDAGIEVLSNH